MATPYVRTIGSIPPEGKLAGITVRQYDDQVALLISGGRTGLDAERREQFAQLWIRVRGPVQGLPVRRRPCKRLHQRGNPGGPEAAMTDLPARRGVQGHGKCADCRHHHASSCLIQITGPRPRRSLGRLLVNCKKD